MKQFLLLIAIITTSLSGQGQQHLAIQKTIADAIAVSNALEVLNQNGENPRLETISNQFTAKLDSLSQLETGFYPHTYPITLYIQEKHQKSIYRIERELIALMAKTREMAKIARHQFEMSRFPILETLLSKHPGDYYTAINPAFSYSLNNHPLRDKIEEIGLQDIPFASNNASGDTSLWHMGTHCPHLKRIHFFGAELNSTALEKLALHKIDSLNVLDLSENQIDVLPKSFNQGNSLTYLDLSKNNLTTLGSGYKTWTHLRFLNIQNNKISKDEITGIKRALPELVLIF